jgi:hypothetical protein
LVEPEKSVSRRLDTGLGLPAKLQVFGHSNWRGTCVTLAECACAASAAGQGVFIMSMSVGAFSAALPNLPSVSKPGADSGPDPLGDLLKALGDSNDAAPPSPAGATKLAGAYDPKTLATMISAQGHGGDAASSAPGNVGIAGAADTASSLDTDADANSSTTQSVTNPDGSITTTVINADGSQTMNTTAPQQDFAALSSDLQKLQSLLAPVAETALMALMI